MAKDNPDSRRQARKRALQILYGIHFATVDSLHELMTAYKDSPAIESAEDEPKGYAWDLVRGVWEKQKAIDARIQALSRHWRLERMGYIERTLLRLSFYELFYTDIPPRVILAETLELGASFAEAPAKKFIAGMIEAAIRDRENSRADER
ncbi:MAG: transcription antitermination factor NusB [Desulfovibrionaceae bacterium]|nr:transcription antitermination factor NusB [Desulfovibrionaceae bacterium]